MNGVNMNGVEENKTTSQNDNKQVDAVVCKRRKRRIPIKRKLELTIKNMTIAFTIVLSLFIVVMIWVAIGVSGTFKEMHNTYIKNTDEIIKVRSEHEISNAWERKPENEKREMLRAQYTEIITYYTINTDDKYKMSSQQIDMTFNQLYNCLRTVPRINFFMAVAYMKVATNFNPVHNRDWKFGLAALYNKTGETICNLPRIKNDEAFFTIWKGLQTLNRPEEAIKLLVARVDDLMLTFNNREDWVFLALFTNEYDVINKYWKNGEGKIPDEIYREGDLAEVLKYYYSFKNWQIPSRDSK